MRLRRLRLRRGRGLTSDSPVATTARPPTTGPTVAMPTPAAPVPPTPHLGDATPDAVPETGPGRADARPPGAGTVRTFHPRRSPLGPRRAEALARLWPTYGFAVDDPDRPPPLTAAGVLDTERLLGRHVPLVVEIGSGMGEAVLAMAAADPDRSYLACDAHVPGVANLVADLVDGGPDNVRVAVGDALELLRRWVPAGSLDAVHAFFPDPWPKARHHKRRLLRPDRLAFLASRLTLGGTLHVATDWAPYADEILAAVDADPSLVNTCDGFAPRPAHRPVTKFEERAAAAGRPAYDVVAVRR